MGNATATIITLLLCLLIVGCGAKTPVETRPSSPQGSGLVFTGTSDKEILSTIQRRMPGKLLGASIRVAHNGLPKDQGLVVLQIDLTGTDPSVVPAEGWTAESGDDDERAGPGSEFSCQKNALLASETLVLFLKRTPQTTSWQVAGVWSTVLRTPTCSTSAKVEQVGDFNGDGQLEVVLQRSADLPQPPSDSGVTLPGQLFFHLLELTPQGALERMTRDHTLPKTDSIDETMCSTRDGGYTFKFTGCAKGKACRLELLFDEGAVCRDEHEQVECKGDLKGLSKEERAYCKLPDDEKCDCGKVETKSTHHRWDTAKSKWLER